MSLPPSPGSSIPNIVILWLLISAPPPFCNTSVLQPSSQHCKYKHTQEDLQKKGKLHKTSSYLKLVFTFNHMCLKPAYFYLVLSELWYNASLSVHFITLFLKARSLFRSKVGHYSLSLKAILQFYSAPLDMHQKPASSCNESQIGPFVTEEINENNEHNAWQAANFFIRN